MPPTELALISRISLLSKAIHLVDLRNQLMHMACMLGVAQLDLLVEYWSISGEARRLWFSTVEEGQGSAAEAQDTDFLFGAASRAELAPAQQCEASSKRPSTDIQMLESPSGQQIELRQVMEFPVGVGLPHRLVLSLTQQRVSPEAESELANATRLILAASRVALMRIFKNSLERIKNKTLTPRELECLKWAALGKTGADTALILSVSEATVAFHLKNAIAKMNAASKAHAVALALSRGWVDLRGGG